MKEARVFHVHTLIAVGNGRRFSGRSMVLMNPVSDVSFIFLKESSSCVITPRRTGGGGERHHILRAPQNTLLSTSHRCPINSHV